MYQQDSNIALKPNIMRLILMGISSLVLCMSFIMSIFTPLPLVMGVLTFGRSKGYAMMSSFWLIAVILSTVAFGDYTLISFYTGGAVVATMIVEIILRKKSPIRGMITSGVGLIGLLSLLFFGILNNSGKSLKESLVSEIKKSSEILEQQKEALKKQDTINDESFEVLALLDNPELMADEVIKKAPIYFFVIVFLMIWVNLFLALKLNRIMFPMRAVYTEVDLIRFKVPDHFIWAVIVGLILAIWGAELGSPWYATIGMSLLQGLGVFYFFQGFGIYLDFLNFVRLGGFIRTLLVMFTVLTASQIIAVIGLFDMFINFRRFFRKSN